MKPHSHSLRLPLGLLALASLGTAGCLCPPCGPPPGVAGAGANAVASGPVSVGSKLVFWDGDGEGAGAKDWITADEKNGGKAKLAPEPGAGVNGSTGLKFHGEGPGFIGFGWNLFGWWPANAGYDITPYSHLTFQIRVEGKTPAEAPEPGAITVRLGCSANANKFESATLPVEKYAKGFSDGKWHLVSIPIAAFLKGASPKFDPQSFWELRMGTWNGESKNFDIYIDDITAEKK
jgi:hypothetical protein